MNEATLSSLDAHKQHAARLRQLGHALNSLGLLMLAGLGLYIAVNLDWVTQALTERHRFLAVIALVFLALGSALVKTANSRIRLEEYPEAGNDNSFRDKESPRHR